MESTHTSPPPREDPWSLGTPTLAQDPAWDLGMGWVGPTWLRTLGLLADSLHLSEPAVPADSHILLGAGLHGYL